jgi:hypothetical protein
MSTATASKHLPELEKEGSIQRKLDTESGEYPYPVSYRIRPKGLEDLSKNQEVRFLRDARLYEVRIPVKIVENTIAETVATFDKKDLAFSKPLGPGDQLRSKEDLLIAGRRTTKMARSLAAALRIAVFTPKGAEPLWFSDDRVKQLTLLLTAYAAGKDPFRIVLSYDPDQADAKTNPSLRKELLHLELACFLQWLHDFKNERISPDDFDLLLPYVFEDKKPDSGFSQDEVDRYKKLWREYARKREKVDSIVNEIRKYGAEFSDYYERLQKLPPDAREQIEKAVRNLQTHAHK